VPRGTKTSSETWSRVQASLAWLLGHLALCNEVARAKPLGYTNAVPAMYTGQAPQSFSPVTLTTHVLPVYAL